MAETLKILAQSNPAATTLTGIYTVPALTSSVISSITICNRSSTGTSFRLSVAIAGAADANQQYLVYDAPIDGNDTISMTLGIGMATTDVFRVYAAAATLSFNLFGAEYT
jgi:hypothetical protein